jgi:VIT1/CCC1 family predicted Fe2+/Mn2+ transporter
MTLDTLIMFFGALVAVLPFLGFPNSWDTVILLVAGVIIVALGVVVRRRGSNGARKHSHFEESSPRFEEDVPADY